MICEDFERLMAEALGDEIEPRDRSRLEAHLAECEHCRLEYESGLRTVAAMRTLSGPKHVHVERRGAKLILHDAAAPTRRAAPFAMRGMFRYAASILIAFVAGYGLHSGLTLTSALSGPEAIVGQGDPGVPADEQMATSAERRIERALLDAHRRNPNRSNLATCMIAMFPTKD